MIASMRFKGLEQVGDRWRVRIMRGRVRYYLGSFDTKERALVTIEDANTAWVHGDVGTLQQMEIEAREMERQRRSTRNRRVGPHDRGLLSNVYKKGKYWQAVVDGRSLGYFKHVEMAVVSAEMDMDIRKLIRDNICTPAVTKRLHAVREELHHAP